MSTDNIEKGVIPAHHFDSVEQEQDAAKQGIWLFLATEILMFGGLFVAYSIFRGKYPEMFHSGSKMLDVTLGAFNTVVLITSSYTMANAVTQTQKGDWQKAFNNVLITLICAGIFMVVKYFEYSHKFHEGMLPGLSFKVEGASQGLGLFFSLYFVMTGLHGIHILVGMALMVWLLIRLKRGEFSPHYYIPVEGVGLYWHIVDIIWIFLFPLMYLIG